MSFYTQWTQSIGELNNICKVTVTKVQGQDVRPVLHDGKHLSLISGNHKSVPGRTRVRKMPGMGKYMFSESTGNALLLERMIPRVITR